MKRFATFVFGIFLTAIPSAAQTTFPSSNTYLKDVPAKVVQLSESEAAAAKVLYQQFADIQQKITDFDATLFAKYAGTKVDPAAATTYGCFSGTMYSCTFQLKDGAYYYKPGWEAGFLYSEDYRFIVPKPFLPCGEKAVQFDGKCYYENGKGNSYSLWYGGSGSFVPATTNLITTNPVGSTASKPKK